MRSERCGGSLRKWTWACFAPRLAGCCKARLQRGIRATFVRALCGPGPAQTGKAGPSDDAPSEKALLRERRLGDLNPGWAPEPGERHQVEQRIQALTLDEVKEPSCVDRQPDHYRRRPRGRTPHVQGGRCSLARFLSHLLGLSQSLLEAGPPARFALGSPHPLLHFFLDPRQLPGLERVVRDLPPHAVLERHAHPPP